MQIADKKDLDVYSTSEQVVGTWIDGKPLYQRTYNLGAIPSGALSGYTMATIETNIDIAFLIEAHAKGSTSMASIPYSTFDSYGIGITLVADNNNLQVRLYTQIDRSYFGTLYVTARYTKTTD